MFKATLALGIGNNFIEFCIIYHLDVETLDFESLSFVDNRLLNLSLTFVLLMLEYSWHN